MVEVADMIFFCFKLLLPKFISPFFIFMPFCFSFMPKTDFFGLSIHLEVPFVMLY